MKFNYLYRGDSRKLDILPSGDAFQAQVDDVAYSLRVLDRDEGTLVFEVDGREQRVHWAKEGRKIWLQLNGQTFALEKSAGPSVGAAAGKSGESVLRAPMPGQVREVMVAEGDEVQPGDVLLLLEAMKMEIRIQAARVGVVARVAVQAGGSVEKDQILVELEDEND